MTIHFQKFSFRLIFCFAYSLSKMALKLTSKISIQVIFWNPSFTPAISYNLLEGKQSWLWIRSAGFKAWLGQKFFIRYFCCLMIFSLCSKYCCCKKCGLPFFKFLEAWKCNLGQINEEKRTAPGKILTRFLRFEVQNYTTALSLLAHE